MANPDVIPERQETKSTATAADPVAVAGFLSNLERYLTQDQNLQPPASENGDPDLEEIRHIVLGREQDILTRIQQRVENPEQFTGAVSEVLPEAIIQAAARDAQLGRALSPTVEKAARVSIKRDAGTLINILYPLMVPAIRKAIAEGLGNSVQSVNEALKHSLSWQGLKWRLESYRTGIPYAEIVLRHTLVYRVEHVFLIHKETGLLLEHVAAEDSAANDPQLVSGMLTAIRDFVRDSFSGSGGGDIDSVRLGELLLWCEQGPYAFLAAFIRGNPPEDLHDVFREALAKIHEQKLQDLENFEGDASIFLDVRDLLVDTLASKKPSQANPSSLHSLFYLLPLALLLLGGYFLFQRYQHHQEFEQFRQRLEAEPGIVVASAEQRDSVWHISGLKDPLATDPDELLKSTKLLPREVVQHWEPYQALHPALVLKRLQASLDPISTAKYALQGNTIRVSGSASHNWLQKAHTFSRTLPLGSPVLDLSAVKDTEIKDFEKLRDAIQARLIYFDHNIPKPAADQDAVLESLAADLKELGELANRFHLPVHVTLTGHADSTGKDTPNLALSMGRAEVVRSLLKAKGVDPGLLSIRGAGPLEPLQTEASEKDRSRNRRVSFTVNLIE